MDPAEYNPNQSIISAKMYKQKDDYFKNVQTKR